MWANTMSTSDLSAIDLPATAGSLDVAAIARLANEFFGALPAATDSATLPATPEGAAAPGPQNPAAVPVQGSPGSPAYISNAAEPPAMIAPPPIPVESGVFTFPDVPGMPSLPDNPVPAAPPPVRVLAPAPDAIPDPLVLDQLASQFLAALPATELYSFPAVPDAPPPPGITPLPAAPSSPDSSLAADRGSPFDGALSFPVTSDLFILPGVPGAQSLPGTPLLPSSPPDQPASGAAAPSETHNEHFDFPARDGPGPGAREAPIRSARDPARLSDPAGARKWAPPDLVG
jgi:hypothetical protein